MVINLEIVRQIIFNEAWWLMRWKPGRALELSLINRYIWYWMHPGNLSSRNWKWMCSATLYWESQQWH